MADLDDLTAFADTHRLDLTHPLTHPKVVDLAEAWIPEIRFHELERFHPVDTSAMFTVPPPIFGAMTDEEKLNFRVPAIVGTDPDGEPIIELFDPPVVFGDGGQRVVSSGATAIDGLDDLEELGDEAFYTHGANTSAARMFFGATTAVSGAENPAPGDPRTPRHVPIVIHAELRMLLEALKHELQLDQLSPALDDHGQPIDAIWSGFAVEDEFFHEDVPGRGEGFSRRHMRSILAAVIAAHEAGDLEPERIARERTPQGWHFVDRAWDAVKQFAFLEYYLLYAFNDYADYGDGPFSNEHEGDVEGCCLVFERQRLERYARGDIPSAADVVPHTAITSAHEGFQDLDDLKRLPIGRDRARRDLLVYAAVGSHATYFTAGDHDILDWEDILTDLPPKTGLLILAIGLANMAALALFVGVVEWLVDVEDHTSDNGASVGPGAPDPANLKFGKRIAVTPLSDFEDGVNIYQDVPAQRDRLPVRGFRGKWGGYDSFFDHSPHWHNKTGRYFRRFLRSDNIEPEGPIVD